MANDQRNDATFSQTTAATSKAPIIRAPIAGPMKQTTFSMLAATALDAVSSPGVSTSCGINPAWADRKGAPTMAVTTATTYTTAVGPSTMITTAVMDARHARIRSVAIMNVRRDMRSATAAPTGPATAAPTNRAAVKRPTPVAPDSWNAHTMMAVP